MYNTLILMVQHMSGLSLAASLTLLASKVKRTLWQFTPVRWDKDEWHPLQATWHVIQLELKPWNLIMSLMNLQGTTTAAGLVDGKDYEK
ncbi:hypothetical protein Bca52824_045453 [Brassica carinata]|uniref:Uncharacterized protein n=1 Tax=Brassica carinata TaxID=52824 RepID=A0A8X7RI81_BRACI|nr:hypothetical protein Bca52824_045453 [Brassica carinata]